MLFHLTPLKKIRQPRSERWNEARWGSLKKNRKLVKIDWNRFYAEFLISMHAQYFLDHDDACFCKSGALLHKLLRIWCVNLISTFLEDSSQTHDHYRAWGPCQLVDGSLMHECIDERLAMIMCSAEGMLLHLSWQSQKKNCCVSQRADHWENIHNFIPASWYGFLSWCAIYKLVYRLLLLNSLKLVLPHKEKHVCMCSCFGVHNIIWTLASS